MTDPVDPKVVDQKTLDKEKAVAKINDVAKFCGIDINFAGKDKRESLDHLFKQVMGSSAGNLFSVLFQGQDKAEVQAATAFQDMVLEAIGQDYQPTVEHLSQSLKNQFEKKVAAGELVFDSPAEQQDFMAKIDQIASEESLSVTKGQWQNLADKLTKAASGVGVDIIKKSRLEDKAPEQTADVAAPKAVGEGISYGKPVKGDVSFKTPVVPAYNLAADGSMAEAGAVDTKTLSNKNIELVKVNGDNQALFISENGKDGVYTTIDGSVDFEKMKEKNPAMLKDLLSQPTYKPQPSPSPGMGAQPGMNMGLTGY